MRVQDFNEIHVGASRPKEFVIAGWASDPHEIHCLWIVHEKDAVRHSRVNKVRLTLYPVDRDPEMQSKPPWVWKPNLDCRQFSHILGFLTQGPRHHLSLDDPGKGLKAHA